MSSDALEDFRRSLKEIDVLCDAAEEPQSERVRYSTFNKAALLLIAGKFETFVESLIEEFLFRLNDLKLPSKSIPESIRLHHTFHALNRLDTVKLKHKRREAMVLFCEIGRLWASEDPFTTLKINAEFSFGKHGENELRKMFVPLGVEDIFDTIRMEEMVEVASSDQPVTTLINFRGVFNSVTSMRNSILHEDASPSLTTSSIRIYRKHFESFASKVDEMLESMLTRDLAKMVDASNQGSGTESVGRTTPRA